MLQPAAKAPRPREQQARRVGYTSTLLFPRLLGDSGHMSSAERLEDAGTPPESAAGLAVLLRSCWQTSGSSVHLLCASGFRVLELEGKGLCVQGHFTCTLL